VQSNNEFTACPTRSRSHDPGVTMLLILALILFLVFGGLGFVAHLLWLGLILAVAVAIAHALTNRT
jgi:hypothetical protein